MLKAKKIHYLLFIQALLAMVWSLYYWWYWDPVVNAQTGFRFSPLNALAPCELCRYARILMYPLVLISFLWIIRKKWDYIYTVIPFASLWLLLEIYHYSMQKFDIANIFTCTYSNPCNALEVNYLWFITIPFLCWTAFLVILTCCYFIHKANKLDK